MYAIVDLELHEGCQGECGAESQLESWVLAECRQHARRLDPLSYFQHAQQVDAVPRSNLPDALVAWLRDGARQQLT